MIDWKEQHVVVIADFLNHLNKQTSDFVLKGGTSLLMCYGLDRFSEDIDLDSTLQHSNVIKKAVASFCEFYGYTFRTAMDMDTVKQYMIDYGNENSKKLKVEVSFRKKQIDRSEYTKINGITVYSIDVICIMKACAYLNRDRIRDLYDLSFIFNKYYEQLSPQTILQLRNAIQYKGIEQFDYLICTQKDELVNENKLTEAFLRIYDGLGLLSDSDEKEMREKFTNDEQSEEDDDFEIEL